MIRASPNLKILVLAQLPTSPSPPSQETLRTFNRHAGQFELFIMADTNKPAVIPPKRALTDYPVRFSSIPQLLQTRSILTLFAAHRLGPVSSTTGHILALHLHGSDSNPRNITNTYFISDMCGGFSGTRDPRTMQLLAELLLHPRLHSGLWKG